jgi:hypothetical protein
MNKIRLAVESLDVQSFVTARIQGPRGTVQGAELLAGPVTLGSYCLTRYCPPESETCPVDTSECATATTNC